MHYYLDNQHREHQLTKDIVTVHRWAIADVLGLNPSDKVIYEFDKQRYGAHGDVDIAVWKNPNKINEVTIGIEVKVIHLNSLGEFKSAKKSKHNKQINALVKDGWDYVFFFDFIVVEPSDDWIHPQAFDGFNKYSKDVECKICGHVIFQMNSVTHKPEVEAGSISSKLIKIAEQNRNNQGRKNILSALKKYPA